MARQLSLSIGGATVDTAKLGSIKFDKKVDELDGQDFNKGDDVIITVRCRLHGGKIIDKYDAHGNIKETVKTFVPVASDLIECKLDTPAAYKAKSESEDDAVPGEARSQRVKAETNNGQAPAEPEPPAAAPAGAGKPELASV